MLLCVCECVWDSTIWKPAISWLRPIHTIFSTLVFIPTPSTYFSIFCLCSELHAALKRKPQSLLLLMRSQISTPPLPKKMHLPYTKKPQQKQKTATRHKNMGENLRHPLNKRSLTKVKVGRLYMRLRAPRKRRKQRKRNEGKKACKTVWSASPQLELQLSSSRM